MTLVERLQKECDRHTIGYPGPRREVAETLQLAADEIERLRQERDEWKAMAAEFKELTEGWEARAEAAEKALETAREALEPFGPLARVILSEAPPEATYTSLFLDCQGISHPITLDALRDVQRALSQKKEG